MDIVELGAIGELVGGVAVIASLIFLGQQVRQNTRSVQNAAHDYTNDAAIGFLRSVYEDPEISRMFWRGMSDPRQFDEDERQRFRTLCTALWLHLEVYFNQWRRGELEPGIWGPLRIRILWYFAQPGMRESWKVGLPLTQAFTQFLESESQHFDGRAYDAVLRPAIEEK